LFIGGFRRALASASARRHRPIQERLASRASSALDGAQRREREKPFDGIAGSAQAVSVFALGAYASRWTRAVERKRKAIRANSLWHVDASDHVMLNPPAAHVATAAGLVWKIWQSPEDHVGTAGSLFMMPGGSQESVGAS